MTNVYKITANADHLLYVYFQKTRRQKTGGRKTSLKTDQGRLVLRSDFADFLAIVIACWL